MNKKQNEYLDLLNDQDCSVIIATGFAGTSKTWMPTAWSCNQLYKIDCINLFYLVLLFQIQNL